MRKRIPIILLFVILSFAFIPHILAGTISKQRVIIVFEDKIDKELIINANGQIVDEIKNYNAVIAHLPVTATFFLKNNSKVAFIEEDQVVEVEGQTEDWGISKVNVPSAWGANITGKGIKVAVLDTGISPHEDLEISGGTSFVSYTTSYYDDNGHGTHVAGVIGAKNNDIGVVGVAPNSSLYSVKVLDRNGNGYLSDIISGIDWATSNKMDIINLSLGTPEDSFLLKQSVDNAYKNGVIVVAAAGNNGSADGSGDTVEYPAKYEAAIAVSAMDQYNKRGLFSATGPHIEVTAPGVNILSTSKDNNYVYMTGTSMASPFVAGNLALLKEAYPNHTHTEIRKLLQKQAIDLGETGKDNYYGHGLVQAPHVIGWDVEYFSNNKLDGLPTVTDVTFSEPLVFDWGFSSPHPSIPFDGFSARFTKRTSFEGGTYLLNTTADDQIKVLIDGNIVMDTTVSQGPKAIEISRGVHSLTIEYYEHSGPAQLSFSISKYKHFTAKANPVQINWGWGSPGNGIPSDYFTATFDQSGTYSKGDYFIQAFADDGVKVEVNGQWPINRWSDYTGTIDRALWLGVPDGTHTIRTHYLENVARAAVFSHVVPLDHWLAYYYPNNTLSGMPKTAKIIPPAGERKKLVEIFGFGAPISGIASDHFTVRYSTAKRIPAGEYILRTKADDGIRVYVDGKKVIDRWSNGSLKEEGVKIQLSDIPNAKAGEQDIHWIEVEYHEGIGSGQLEFFIEPFYTEVNNSWVGEIYPNLTLEGNPYILGGKNAENQINTLKFDWGWGYGSPHVEVKGDDFTARYTKMVNLEAGTYLFTAMADDGVRVLVDDNVIIDAWSNNDMKPKEVITMLSGGSHTIVVEYKENVGAARLSFDYKKLAQLPTKVGKEVQENWGWGSPASGIHSDYFMGVFDQSGSYSNGDYFIQTFADDGIMVEVNGQWPINRWSEFSGTLDRALWLGVTEGSHTIRTHYLEKVARAAVFSHVVPLDHWLAYYYPNNTLSGMPKTAKVIPPSGENKKLIEKFGFGSPASGMPSDHFTVRYATAKRLAPGEYLLRTKVDDGVRVYVDGKKVIDRWPNGSLKEDGVKIQISDLPNANAGEQDVHWIEVEYLEGIGSGEIEFFIEPFSNEVENTWVGEIYPNLHLQGIPYVVGGKNAIHQINSINFDWGWGYGSPHGAVKGDEFTARYTKEVYLEAGNYLFTAHADDGVRVLLDNRVIIDAWSSNNGQQVAFINEGKHIIVVEYIEYVGAAKLSFSYELQH